MSRARHLPAALLALIVMAAGPTGAASPTLSDCRKLTDAGQRLSCYDRIPLETGSSARAHRTEQPPDQSSLPSAELSPGGETPDRTNAEAAAQDLFGRNETDSRDLIEGTLGIADLSELHADVERVDRNPYGKLIIVLDNQQVWAQIDSGRLNLDRGDRVRIESAVSGSYLLEKLPGSRQIRVRRVE